jgi:hypothetical protein
MSLDGTDNAGTTGTANSDSSNDGGQQSSITVTETAKQIQALRTQVEELTRGLQSSKDKGIAKTNQRIDSLEKDIKSVLKSAAQRGQSVQEVLGEIEADEERESREALLEMARAYKSERTSGANGLGGQQTSGVDVTNVLRELELDESDTRVQEFRARNFSSESEAYKQAALLLKSITTRQPSEADLPSGVAKGAMKPDEVQRLMQEYEQKSKNLRGQALVNLKMEYRKKGLRSIY